MAYQIHKHRGTGSATVGNSHNRLSRGASLFFDWVGVNFDSVIHILENFQSIDEILHFDAVKKVGEWKNRSRVIFDSLSEPRLAGGFFRSSYDLKIDFSDEEVLLFVARYKRRFNRVLKLIEGADKLFFCRVAAHQISSRQKNRFIKAVHSINENCKFTLVGVCYEQKEKSIYKEDFFLNINLVDPEKLEHNPHLRAAWKLDHIDWAGVFKDIEKYG